MIIKHVFYGAALLVAGLSLGACNRVSEDSAAGADSTESPATSPAATAAEAPTSLPRTPSPAGARVFFISPADGDTVTNPVTVQFGIEGMSVARAGNPEAHSGHHHLIIDADLPDLSMPIPASEHYVHFGDASESTTLTLEPGTHSLRLLLGDHLHIPHDPPVVSEPITVVVE